MRRIAAIAISIIVALSMATPIALVGAQGPPGDVELDFKASELDPPLVLCEFDVHFHLSGKQGTIESPGGELIITSPGLTATLTNVTSGESVTLSITGTITETVLANGDVQRVMHGRNIFFDPLEGFVLLIGEFTGVAKQPENLLVQPLEGNGRKIDLCALLS
jgi:hypothetical protein